MKEKNFKKTPIHTLIPKDWDIAHLEKVAKIQTGVSKSSGRSLVNPISVPYLRVANVQDGYFDLSQIKKIDIEEEKLERYQLKNGDVLMTEGGDFDKLGRGSVWRGQIDPCVHQNHVFVVRPNPNKLLSEYLSAISSSYYGRKYFTLCSKQSTNLASINSSQLKAFPIPLPKLQEQTQINSILSKWDTAITQTQKLIEAKQKLKRGLEQQLLTAKTRLGGYSGSWKEVSLKDVLVSRKTKQTPSEAVPLFSLTIEKGITPKTERYNREALVKDKKEKKYKVVKPFDIVYNPANLRWGAINISRENHDVVVSPIYEVLRMKNTNLCDREFIIQALMSSRQIKKFSLLVEGTLIERMAVKIDAFLNSKILIPEISEQKKISKILNNIDNEVLNNCGFELA